MRKEKVGFETRFLEYGCSRLFFIVLLVEEAQLAFLLNQHLFSAIQLPKGTIPNFGPLGENPPDLNPTLRDEDEDEEKPREIPVEIGHNGRAEDSYSVQSLVALIMAACITHFVLGGYTGKGGEQRLQEVFQWLANLAGFNTPVALEA